MLSHALNTSIRLRRTRSAILVAAIGSAAALAAPAHGAIAVTNENNGDGGIALFMFAPDGYRATSFTTGNTAATIGSLDARVANRAGLGSTEAYITSIYADAGGIPGALVGTFNPLNFTQTIFNQFQSVSFNTPGINVAANTTYWVVMGTPASAQGADWLGSSLPNETSSIGWTIGNNALVFAGGGGPGWIPVGGPGRFTINLIPAPGAAGLLAIGGMLASRRRRHSSR